MKGTNIVGGGGCRCFRWSQHLVIPMHAAGGREPAPSEAGGTCCSHAAPQPMWRQPPRLSAERSDAKRQQKGGNIRRVRHQIPAQRYGAEYARVARTLLSGVFPRERKAKTPEPASDDACHPEARALCGPKDPCNSPVATMVHALATLSTVKGRQPPFAHVREGTRICLAHVETAASRACPERSRGVQGAKRRPGWAHSKPNLCHPDRSGAKASEVEGPAVWAVPLPTRPIKLQPRKGGI